MNKRGVSPLIATVLLVMIVVSIGAAVMVLIQGINQESIDATTKQQGILRCTSDVELTPITLGNKYRICINDSVFAISLENKGQDISDFRIVFFADNIITIDGKTAGVSKNSFVDLKYDISSINNYSKIEKIKLYPKIPGNAGSQIISCDEPNLEWTKEQIKYFSNCNTTTWDDNIQILGP
ncbi:MAG: archaellin/type IV pilin N-terminal domain-containing protein [Candidatus Woesearchaeota archaeon]